MGKRKYLMESEDEALRLDMKTDNKATEQQALWAGLKPGMRVADLGCGSGKTTYCLNKLVQPNGRAVGVDISEQRIEFAKKHYNSKNIEFICKDIRDPLEDLGKFDFIWVRFVLEYHRSNSFEIVKNISKILNPGGILCLIDLDYNCLSHFGLSPKVKNTLFSLMQTVEEKADFDPYVGIKLYSYLYDLSFDNIDVGMAPHHLIFGEVNEVDAFNWTKKLEIAGKGSGYLFNEYEGGYEEFFEEFKSFFYNPRRFTYTPLISCRGCKSKELSKL
jgi:ubiquinone/menaquinone biosynthesis C-methylase UbiE